MTSPTLSGATLVGSWLSVWPWHGPLSCLEPPLQFFYAKGQGIFKVPHLSDTKSRWQEQSYTF